MDKQESKGIVDCMPYGIPGFSSCFKAGSGAFGQVWVAKQTSTGGWRAVKIISEPECGSKRYALEREAVKQYVDVSKEYKGLIQILHADENADAFWYIMHVADDVRTGREINPVRYIPRTLGHDLKANPVLPTKICLDVITRITRAVAFLHQKKLMHRDIKPDNILFFDDKPKLGDIGLVSDVASRDFAYGTHGYAPPEKERSPAGDVYSIGKVLYVMLFGREPEDFPNTPITGADTDNDTFGKLNQIIHRACEDDPANRYPDAKTLLKALEGLGKRKTKFGQHNTVSGLDGVNVSPIRKRIKIALALLAAAGLSGILMWPYFCPTGGRQANLQLDILNPEAKIYLSTEMSSAPNVKVLIPIDVGSAPPGYDYIRLPFFPHDGDSIQFTLLDGKQLTSHEQQVLIGAAKGVGYVVLIGLKVYANTEGGEIPADGKTSATSVTKRLENAVVLAFMEYPFVGNLGAEKCKVEARRPKYPRDAHTITLLQRGGGCSRTTARISLKVFYPLAK